MKKIIEFFEKYQVILAYSVLLALILTIAYIVFTQPQTKTALVAMESKTFDIRQIFLSEHKKTNENIIVVTVDDMSYEYLLENYGDWPIPRYLYGEFLDYVEAQKPAIVAFDFLFISALRNAPRSDERFIEALNRYDNVFTAMNFDDQPVSVRKPPELPEYIKDNFKIESKNLVPRRYTNCRAILKGIMEAVKNVGHINTPKSDDGVNRIVPLFITYPAIKENSAESPQQDDKFLYMTIKVAKRYLADTKGMTFENEKIDRNNNYIFGDRKIPLTNRGDIILNWYGKSGSTEGKTFTYVPLWKILESVKLKRDGKTELFENEYFKDKIIYVGTNVFALSDIKTVPTDKYMPGVEIHATLLNNILDNSAIKQLSIPANILITILVAGIIALIVMTFNSTIVAIVSSLVFASAYVFLTYVLMRYFNLWIWIVWPLTASILTFIILYIVKYLIKSRDLEYTYKLATTDGLTELHNHRYFQERMLDSIALSDRYKQTFSLIMIDIDFFKKFNDSYGHQAGDAVLKNVAQTLKKSVRTTDIVCRYGGEEMTIILRDISHEDALKMAQKICSTIAEKKFQLTPELQCHVTISLGVSTYPENGKTPTELIEYADQQLYKAKENGRNQVGNFAPEKE
ncbi:diguanylate cyclase [bacterium]|nr:diguanylate cyclase [bacterium]